MANYLWQKQGQNALYKLTKPYRHTFDDCRRVGCLARHLRPADGIIVYTR